MQRWPSGKICEIMQVTIYVQLKLSNMMPESFVIQTGLCLQTTLHSIFTQ